MWLMVSESLALSCHQWTILFDCFQTIQILALCKNMREGGNLWSTFLYAVFIIIIVLGNFPSSTVTERSSETESHTSTSCCSGNTKRSLSQTWFESHFSNLLCCHSSVNLSLHKCNAAALWISALLCGIGGMVRHQSRLKGDREASCIGRFWEVGTSICQGSLGGFDSASEQG